MEKAVVAVILRALHFSDANVGFALLPAQVSRLRGQGNLQKGSGVGITPFG